MAELNRKKAILHPRRLNRPPTAAAIPQTDQLIFDTGHPKHPYTFDLTSFANGSHGPRRECSRSKWIRNFSGRPILTQQIAQSIRRIHRESSAYTCKNVEAALRAVWRVLDDCDSILGNAPVLAVSDLNDLHNAAVIRAGTSSQYISTFRRLADDCRSQLGLPPLLWVTPPRSSSSSKDALSTKQVIAIYRVLKERVRSTFDLWDKNPTRPPAKTEISNVMFLFLVKTGWNESVWRDVQREDFAFPHPTDPKREIVFSEKRRGDTRQVVHSLLSHTWSPGNLIRRCIHQSRGLHARVKVEAGKLMETLDADTSTTNRSGLGAKLAEAQAMERSPWLYAFKVFKNDTACYDDKDGSWTVARHRHADSGGPVGSTTNRKHSFLVALVAEANTRLPRDSQIGQICTKELRSAYVAFHFERHGYQWVAASLAAGHSSLRSAVTYLRKRCFRVYGEDQVRRFGTALFDEIRDFQLVEPAFLYALMQRGVVTPDQRDRWLAGKDRTYMGTGCIDFTHPPQAIAPNHMPGAGCRVQRCTLCPHAIVFGDSIDGLARRKAELVHLKSKMPLPSWISSSFAEELENVDRYLARMSKSEVSERTSYWSDEIVAGRHAPMHFEGEYSA